MVRSYWEAVAEQIPTWGLVQQGKLSASEVRQDYIDCHSIALQALGRVGNALIKFHPDDWKKGFIGLRQIDWSRHNLELWEGRGLINGRVSKMTNHIILTENVIKQALALPLEEDPK